MTLTAKAVPGGLRGGRAAHAAGGAGRVGLARRQHQQLAVGARAHRNGAGGGRGQAPLVNWIVMLVAHPCARLV